MRKITFILFMAICGLTYGQKNIKELVRNGETWTEPGSKTPYTGAFVEYFDNGKLMGTGAFKAGLPDGLRTIYYPNGSKKNETNYNSGVKEGKSIDYHENGKVSQEGMFEKGLAEGTWRIYYPDGVSKAVLNFSKGSEKGDYMEYNTAGKLTAQYYISNGETGYSPEFMKVTQEASAFAKQGKTKEAIELYDQAVKLNPTVAQVYHKRGVLKANAMSFEEAIRDYDLAIELDPKYKEAYSNRGISKINILNAQNGAGKKPTAAEAKSACEDFHKAVSLGDKSMGTEDMIFLYCKKK